MIPICIAMGICRMRSPQKIIAPVKIGTIVNPEDPVSLGGV
jgi:hypothetical protein